MASIKDVAVAAGVSTATVSRVLSDSPNVRPEVRERVMAAIEQLHYRPNLIARSLRSQHSLTLGLIVSDIRNPFFTSISRAVEDIAYEQGYSVLLCNTDEDPEKEKIYLQLMRDANVAGAIVSPTQQILANLRQSRLECPLVMVDRHISGMDVDAVLLDNIDVTARLTSHLIENGFQRIGALFGQTSSGTVSNTGQQRYLGFERALRSHGLPIEQELIRYTSPHIEEGYQAALELLALPQVPDAILTSNSLTMEGALKAIRNKHLTIPDDIALVGFDETPWASLVQPAITLIEQPTYEIGKTAAELLLERLADPARTVRQITLRGTLLIRGSSAIRRLQPS